SHPSSTPPSLPEQKWNHRSPENAREFFNGIGDFLPVERGGRRSGFGGGGRVRIETETLHACSVT
ncbi:MAG: hypothetical protein SGJ21_16645, partial [Alphaproteobacteria bacterium]|nr:hypothetical protein [Alphaproteobacteria bacterium]